MSQSHAKSLLNELNQLERLREPRTTKDSRRFTRFVIRGEAELSAIERERVDEPPIRVALRDAGRGGLGFVSPQLLPLQSTWRVGFLSQGFVFAQQPIIVRHCKRIDQGVYLIGSQFCIETGILCLLGVSPADILTGDAPDESLDSFDFLPPGEVA